MTARVLGVAVAAWPLATGLAYTLHHLAQQALHRRQPVPDDAWLRAEMARYRQQLTHLPHNQPEHHR